MAGNREMYERTHQGIGNKTFETIRDNLLYLSERKLAAGSGRPITTLINVVFSENADGISDFIEFADAVKADRVSFQPFDDFGDPGLSGLVPTEEQAAFVREHLTALKAHVESRKIVHNIDFFLKAFRGKIDTMGLYKRIPCHIGWLSVLFKPDGNVYPCCRCYTPLGNTYETGFNEIWKGQAYRRFRREAVQINDRGKPVDGCSCETCPHYTLNLRVYKFLHPLRGRSSRLGESLLNGCGEDPE
jgi:radical SAM protein with 4Fe4S-binding SPASM domain